MGRVVLAPPAAAVKDDDTDAKARLVTEICSVSAMFVACTHRRQRRNPLKPVFIDWYLLLRVEEDAGMDVIRRRYRQLALQLHPDKNKHPKAELAFKLVSEAYECLSDKSRRSAFNTERWSTSCPACRGKAQQSQRTSKTSGPTTARTTTPFHPAADAVPATRPRRTLQALLEARRRVEEEARVIDMCLRRSNSAAVRGVGQGETPVFDPADYRGFSTGYPHSRRVSATMPGPKGFWHLSPGGLGCARSCRGGNDPRRCETPLFEIRTEGYRTPQSSRCS